MSAASRAREQEARRQIAENAANTLYDDIPGPDRPIVPLDPELARLLARWCGNRGRDGQAMASELGWARLHVTDDAEQPLQGRRRPTSGEIKARQMVAGLMALTTGF